MVRRILGLLCIALLAAMVLFTGYTVLMRVAFDDPPFWGDTITLFANVWLVLLALPLAVRERDHISMQMLYDALPDRFAIALEALWNALLLAMGVVIAIYGAEAAWRIPGAFWELGNLPKTYPMLILPISGTLIAVASGLVLFEDWQRLKSGKRLDGKDADELR
jgi:TRAP-type C4-dicarboxylate transport system permease small subunit